MKQPVLAQKNIKILNLRKVNLPQALEEIKSFAFRKTKGNNLQVQIFNILMLMPVPLQD